MFSDGACAHFKNNASILNQIHHKIDFDLNACWTFTATGHGRGADDGIVAVLKPIARRATLSKTIFMSNAKDFYEFSQKQQVEIARKSNKDTPGVHVFFLESDVVEEVKSNYLNVRSEKLRTRGEKDLCFYSFMLVLCRVQSKESELCLNSNRLVILWFNIT